MVVAETPMPMRAGTVAVVGTVAAVVGTVAAVVGTAVAVAETVVVGTVAAVEMRLPMRLGTVAETPPPMRLGTVVAVAVLTGMAAIAGETPPLSSPRKRDRPRWRNLRSRPNSDKSDGQMDDVRNKAKAAIAKVLTKKQKTSFNKMLGEPFDLEKAGLAYNSRGPGGPGGRGPNGAAATPAKAATPAATAPAAASAPAAATPAKKSLSDRRKDD